MPKKKKKSELTVSEQSSQTPAAEAPSQALAPAPLNGEFVQEPADIALSGDPVLMSPDELADIVIQGFRKLRPYQRYIAELHRRFTIAERDENNRLLKPIKSCYTFREFCKKHLGRTAEAVYKMMRAADPAKKPRQRTQQPQLPEPGTPVKEKIAFPRYADELSTPLIDKVTHSDYDAETQIKILRIIAGNIQAAIPEIEAEIKLAA